MLKDAVGKHPDIAHEPEVAYMAAMSAAAVMAHKASHVLAACKALASSVRNT